METLIALAICLIVVVYFLYKRKWKLAILFTLLLPIIAFFLIESYFAPFPLIDTFHSPEFTLEKFDQVKVGMSKNQVRALIGTPPSEIYIPEENPNNCENQTNDGASKYWDFAWYHAEVCFDEQNNVNSTNGFWQYD